MHTHTFLRSRGITTFSCCSTQSLLGTAFFFSHRFVLNDSAPPRFRPSRCSKSDASKCTEQSTDVFDGCQFAQCLRTKRTHFSRIASSWGNICIDTPSVLKLFLQLTFPGPPATQYLPEILFFSFSTFTPHSMLTRGLLWARRCTQPVTSQGCFGRAKMAANFDPSRSTSNG